MGKFFHPQPGDAKSAPVKFEVPHGWIYRTFTVDGLKMEQVQNPSGKKGRVLLKLHGGYVQGLHDRHRQMGVNQAVLTEAQSLYMVHYRLAPDYPFPDALEDAFKAYEYILNQGVEPENIIVIDDSAGGEPGLGTGGISQRAIIHQGSPSFYIFTYERIIVSFAITDLILNTGVFKIPAIGRAYQILNIMGNV